jgi:phytoene dehydrogenase-like protein
VSSSRYDVIIIGAGLAGLAAGIRCAQFFKRVLIVESHSKLGGLNSYYHKFSRDHLFSNGLHTITNFNPTSRRWGAALIARNLGLKFEDLEIYPAKYPSRITLPQVELTFDNDPRTLEQSIATLFPAEIDGYRRLVAAVMDESGRPAPSTEDCFAYLAEFIASPDLRDALALPILSYGGFREGTIDSRMFAILFRSLLLEGCGSPLDMKVFLERLQARYEALGGELARRCTVERIAVRDGELAAVILSDGRELTGGAVLSSAGLTETGRLCGHTWGEPGTISVFQWIGVYDRPLEQLGIGDTLRFVCRSPRLSWHIPGDRPFTDILTYSISDSYAFPQPVKAHLKISCFSKATEWRHLDDTAYEAQKARYAEELLERSYEYYPSLRQTQPTVVDAFTPLTVEHYTRHPGGTIYGGTQKTYDGRTAVRNLYIIGNDQGGIGIMGAMTSGILVSNFNVLLGK